jgi:hypothetical protein
MIRAANLGREEAGKEAIAASSDALLPRNSDWFFAKKAPQPAGRLL